jgi:hypothetical protein
MRSPRGRRISRLKKLRIDPVADGIDVIVSGHSHKAAIEIVNGILYLNPGSAGPRRFKLSITLATLDIGPGGLSPIIHDLGKAEQGSLCGPFDKGVADDRNSRWCGRVCLRR